MTKLNEKACYMCSKTPLSKNEIGLVKKLIDKKVTNFIAWGVWQKCWK